MDNALLYKNSLNEHDIAEIRQLQGPIWVVGASGFIGAALFFALREHRQDVYAVSRRTDRSWRLLQVPREAARKQFINLDITQPRAVEQAVQLHRPRTVFNLAAYGAYERQNDGPRIHQVNYLGTFHLLQALFAQGCEAFVQAGSSSEYGLNCQGPREQDELKPNSDYAVSKGATALACLAETLALCAKLPSGYQRDLQLLKAPLFRGIDVAQRSVDIAAPAIDALQFNAANIRIDPAVHAAGEAFALVVSEGLPFRDAYRRIAERFARSGRKESSS